MLSCKSAGLVLPGDECLFDLLGRLGLLLSRFLSDFGFRCIELSLTHFSLECMLLGFRSLSLIMLFFEVGEVFSVVLLVSLQS